MASPSWGHGSSLPRTPSPTNPFFPGNEKDQGLGLNTSPLLDGPFPTARPLPNGMSDLSSSYSSDTNMAGVGRRAFQAAAWGVTASISLASSARERQERKQAPASFQRQPNQVLSPPPQWPQPLQNASREPVVPPKKPLAGRQRSGTVAAPEKPLPPPVSYISPPSRTTPLADSAPITSSHARKQSVASVASSTSSGYGIRGETVSELLKARSGQKPQGERQAFFDKYKEMQRSNSNSTSGMIPRRASNASKMSRADDQELVASPQQTTFDLEFDDDEASALPWASPPQPEYEHDRKQHTRNTTADSAESAKSSAKGSSSGPGSVELITPSISLERLAIVGGKEQAAYDARRLKHISERVEDEEDRVVFGGPLPTLPQVQGKSAADTRTATLQVHTVASKSHSKRPSQSRSKTDPTAGRKSCQKCGTAVGGQRRYVERDGVVLCVDDWKKMYLPSCRRCNLLIETKMISADDGQLKGKWHASCFTCTRCDEPFKDKDFYVHAGMPWCQYHYAEETGTLCNAHTCRRPIEGACIVIQSSTTGSKVARYHPGHFRCEVPGCRESMDEYYEIGGKRYCERHGVSSQYRNDRSGKAEKRRTRLVDLPSRINF